MKVIAIVNLPFDVEPSKEDAYFVMRDGKYCQRVCLKPLPEEEEPTNEVVELGSYNEGYGNGYECGFADGWNACLKEIQK